jgi:hypothetical protein
MLWSAPETTAVDRKEIIRLLVERVAVQVRTDSEKTEVTISWKGGSTTQHEIARSVSRYESMIGYKDLMARIVQLGKDGKTIVIARSVSRYESMIGYKDLMARIVQLGKDGKTIVEVATQLNQEGFRTPRSGKGHTSTSIRKLLSRCGLTCKRSRSK